MTRSSDAGLRDAAFRVFAGSSMLVMDLQTDAVLGVLKTGLQDAESVDVNICTSFSLSLFLRILVHNN